MVERRHGLTLQGTSWSSSSGERLRREARTDDDAYNEIRRQKHRRGEMCVAKAVLAIIVREFQEWDVWRVPENGIFNVPSVTRNFQEEWPLELTFVWPGGRLFVEGPVADRNGCIYGFRKMKVKDRPLAPNARPQVITGRVSVGGKTYKAKSEWQDFYDDFNDIVSIEVLRIKASERNIFA